MSSKSAYSSDSHATTARAEATFWLVTCSASIPLLGKGHFYAQQTDIFSITTRNYHSQIYFSELFRDSDIDGPDDRSWGDSCGLPSIAPLLQYLDAGGDTGLLGVERLRSLVYQSCRDI